MTSACIWALLTIKELEFIHVSSFTKLKGHSLFHFIHPDEVLLAERDLFKFISSNKFGGSITRCRMKNYTTTSSSSWIIVDIIMYIATKNLVLCFLHQQVDSHCCKIMNETSTHELRDCLQKDVQEEGEYQIFHIFDNQTRSVVLTWPDHYSYDDTQIDNDRSVSPKSSCFHCVQRSPRLNTLGQRVDTLFIHYGRYTFILDSIEPTVFSVSPPMKRKKQQQQHHHHHPYSLQQQHQIQCQSCGTDSSPEWRRGPTGHKTLCNACGLRYSRSVARLTKQKQQQQQQQQHSLIKSQHTPLCSPESIFPH